MVKTAKRRVRVCQDLRIEGLRPLALPLVPPGSKTYREEKQDEDVRAKQQPLTLLLRHELTNSLG